MERLKILGATLPSIEEAEKLPDHLRKYDCWWWLRSPGYFQNVAAAVRDVSSVGYGGSCVHLNSGAVRPALKISTLESSDLQIGDRFDFGGVEFEVISDNLAFCVGDIGCHAFRKDWRAKDANDYEASDVKRFVDGWFKKAKEQPIIPKRKYAITFSVNATYTTEVYASSFDKAEVLAAQNFSDADFGVAENIDGDVISIEDADENRLKGR